MDRIQKLFELSRYAIIIWSIKLGHVIGIGSEVKSTDSTIKLSLMKMSILSITDHTLVFFENMGELSNSRPHERR